MNTISMSLYQLKGISTTSNKNIGRIRDHSQTRTKVNLERGLFEFFFIEKLYDLYLIKIIFIYI